MDMRIDDRLLKLAEEQRRIQTELMVVQMGIANEKARALGTSPFFSSCLGMVC